MIYWQARLAKRRLIPDFIWYASREVDHISHLDQPMSAELRYLPLSKYESGKTNIRRPKEVAYFSYDKQHKLHTLSDASLKYYCPPLFGAPGEPVRGGDGNELDGASKEVDRPAPGKFNGCGGGTRTFAFLGCASSAYVSRNSRP